MANDLKHVGVLGMKWGHRKSPEQQAHQDKVKQLKSQIKSKSDSRWEAERKKFSRDETEAYKRIESIKNNKLSAHDKQSKGLFDSLVGRGFIKLNASIDKSNVVGKLEDKIISDTDKRNKAKHKAQMNVLKKFDKDAERLYRERVKGLKFPKDIVEALKLDKEMGMKITEAMLELDLKYA